MPRGSRRWVVAEPRIGMTRTELMHHFAKNLSGEQLGRALAVLVRGSFVKSELEKPGGRGRPTERWRATR